MLQAIQITLNNFQFTFDSIDPFQSQESQKLFEQIQKN